MFKKIISTILSLVIVMSPMNVYMQQANAQETSLTSAINFIENDGYEEGVYAKWTSVEGAVGYKAYVGNATDDKWTLLDDQLIREYEDYFRVDAVGLSAGVWSLKVEAINGNSKVIVEGVSAPLKVTNYDRSGFAWNNGKTASGAYNEDGSLKENAVVVYVTGENYNSVSAVLTDNSGKTTTATGFSGILNACSNYKKYPLDVRVIGNVKANECYSIIGAQNITIEGVGEDATINGGGFSVKNSSNIEIRNLGIMNASYGENDDIGVESSTNVWVHNNDLFYGKMGNDGDLDQAKGDGALDCKRSDYATFSYNHFWDNGKASLLGSGSSETASFGKHITYHHNWFDHSDERNPRVRFFTAHIYNNYFDGVAKYGSGSTLQSSLFVESNYYRNTKYPMMISAQGSDMFAGGKVYDFSNRNFSGENGGMIKSYGNVFAGKFTFIPYGSAEYFNKGHKETFDLIETSAVEHFDAYVADNRNDKVPEGVKPFKTENGMYNNFDTAESMYKYPVDNAVDVPEIVMRKAGRLNGGDFWWNFTDANDDGDNGRNAELSDALDNYVGSVHSIGGINRVDCKSYSEVGYKRYIRNALSNTNGELYSDKCELISKGEDYTKVKDGYERTTFVAEDFIRNGLKITEAVAEDRDLEVQTVSENIVFNNSVIPANSLNTLMLRRDAIERGNAEIEVGENASIIICAGTDAMEIHCDVQLLDASGNKVRERIGSTEIMHRAATTLRYDLAKAGKYTFGYPKDSSKNGSIRIYSITIMYRDDKFENTAQEYIHEHTVTPVYVPVDGDKPGEENPPKEEKPSDKELVIKEVENHYKDAAELVGSKGDGEVTTSRAELNGKLTDTLPMVDTYKKGRVRSVFVAPKTGKTVIENSVTINAGVKLYIKGIEEAESINIKDVSGNLGTIKNNDGSKPSFAGGRIKKGILTTKPVKNVAKQIYDITSGDVSLRVTVLNIGFEAGYKKEVFESGVPKTVSLDSEEKNSITCGLWFVGKSKLPLKPGEKTAIHKTAKEDSPVIAYARMSEDGKSVTLESTEVPAGKLQIKAMVHGKIYKTYIIGR